MIFLLLFTMFNFFSKSTLPKNTNRARAPQFERARRRWRKQIGPRQGVSSSSCKLHCSWLRCKKSSAPFPVSFVPCEAALWYQLVWISKAEANAVSPHAESVIRSHLFAFASCFSPACSRTHLHSPWPSLSGVMAPKGSPVTLSFYLLAALKLPVLGVY